MGYTDYQLWKRLDEAGYKFVCRLKDNAKFKIIEQRKCPEKDIIADQIIEFAYDKYVERPMTLTRNSNIVVAEGPILASSP